MQRVPCVRARHASSRLLAEGGRSQRRLLGPAPLALRIRPALAPACWGRVLMSTRRLRHSMQDDGEDRGAPLRPPRLWTSKPGWRIWRGPSHGCGERMKSCRSRILVEEMPTAPPVLGLRPSHPDLQRSSRREPRERRRCGLPLQLVPGWRPRVRPTPLWGTACDRPTASRSSSASPRGRRHVTTARTPRRSRPTGARGGGWRPRWATLGRATQEGPRQAAAA
mmetsp:Transcript_75595/g.173035  ORF Transcript_75595/g.173035 Transcript_75595/m.173035 type:complete len:223 (+) Transcript_75595:362-1030(+)